MPETRGPLTLARFVERTKKRPYDRSEGDAAWIHAGKVFSLDLDTLLRSGVPVAASDQSLGEDVDRHYFLCLWDLLNGQSAWVTLQRRGDVAIPDEEKYNLGKTDEGWIGKTSYFRTDGTIWLIGARDQTFSYEQEERRGVTRRGLAWVRHQLLSDPFGLGSVDDMLRLAGYL